VQSGSRKRIKIILTLPRCGTHFIWARLIASGRYQLIYDADRIPALQVLSMYYNKKLDFLYPAPINPNYSFQYNSLKDIHEPLTASEHLKALEKMYHAQPGYELFNRIMSLQENDGRCLFSVNRFVYTGSYKFLFKDFEYTIHHAIRALTLMHEWMARSEYDPLFMLVIREIPEWIKSQFVLMGDDKDSRDQAIKRLEELPVVLKTCQNLKIPIFFMRDVIKEMNENKLNFESALKPLSDSVIEEICNTVKFHMSDIEVFRQRDNTKKYFKRFLQYIVEKDPFEKISLVRSIYRLPIPRRIPYLGRRIQADYDGVILNNARIKKI